MNFPPLLKLDSVKAYKEYYESNYQRQAIYTFDGIRVYFKPEKFGHAFYENSQHKAGIKDSFSQSRSERMSWIRLTLENQNANLYKGWNKSKKQYDDDRRVSVVYGDFIVIIELSLTKTGELKGNFITCYVADNSLHKIKKSPLWDKKACIDKLKK